jgi:hypothetical protein
MRTRRCSLLSLAALMVVGQATAQRVDSLGPEARKYLRVTTSRVVLEHVRIIDGTGAPAAADQKHHH